MSRTLELGEQLEELDQPATAFFHLGRGDGADLLPFADVPGDGVPVNAEVATKTAVLVRLPHVRGGGVVVVGREHAGAVGRCPGRRFEQEQNSGGDPSAVGIDVRHVALARLDDALRQTIDRRDVRLPETRSFRRQEVRIAVHAR